MFGRPGGWELILILVVILILFGPKQLPKLGKMFGSTMRSIREGAEGKLEDGDEGDDASTTKAAAPSEEDSKV